LRFAQLPPQRGRRRRAGDDAVTRMTPMPVRPPRSPSLSYRDAGVDIDAGDALVERIKPFAKRTMRAEVLAGIGGFGALSKCRSGTRNRCSSRGPMGVGTKLKLAFALEAHETMASTSWR
jgi:phosphoribosylformylglycinamidine cyclo-ligase